MRRLVWLDLCSGLGGASQPAVDRGWKVIRADIDPRFDPDLLMDLTDSDALRLIREHLNRRNAKHLNVLWASTPCDDYARMTLPWLRKQCLKMTEPEPSLSILKAAHALRLKLDPDFWIFENTIHSRRWLTPILGPVRAAIAGHYFWGNIPCLLPDVERVPKENLWPSKMRAAERAKIPYEIGDAICRAVEARVSD